MMMPAGKDAVNRIAMVFLSGSSKVAPSHQLEAHPLDVPLSDRHGECTVRNPIIVNVHSSWPSLGRLDRAMPNISHYTSTAMWSRFLP
jgi:hypothetical protein